MKFRIVLRGANGYMFMVHKRALSWPSATARGRLETLTTTPAIVAPVRHRA
jgi:hypothetical protein